MSMLPSRLSDPPEPSRPGGALIPLPPSGPPIQMKMRPDLTFDQMSYQGVEYWVVKEPVGQKYFQFPPSVFFLLRQLDGTRSMEQLQDAYHREHAPKRITRQELQQLLTRFHQDGLVTSDLPGQGAELLKRGQKQQRMERFGQLANILAIRWKGFDPERILDFLLPYTWWIFTKAAATVVLILASIALLSVLTHWADFQAKLPGFESFFDPRQWYLFAIVLAFTKICHEFGHGLSCKRLGGECHEIGFMLLVLTPCLYCNVSDSWRLPNKWHRAAIGAAGMYVEVILATLATFIWWFVQPGLVQDLCLKVMLVSSISTILFNGNPLLRFDGYYILSDLLEIPNLNQKSTRALTTLLGRHWLGLEIPDDSLMPRHRPLAFAMFTVAAFCYRWLILFSIIYFLMTMLEPYNLESIGIGIALFSVAGMIGMPAYKLFRYLSVPGRMHQVNKRRFFSVLAVAAVVGGLALLVPYPHYLRCNLIVMPLEIETVWVRQSGRLEELAVEAGTEVVAGDTIARLVDPDLEIQLKQVEAKLLEKRAELELEKRRAIVGGPGGASVTRTIAAELAKLTTRQSRLLQQRVDLKLTSPIAGTVLATPYEHPSSMVDNEVPVDVPTLLSGQHTDLGLRRGQRFCEVADLTRWHAVVILTEHQVKFARIGQPVRVKLYSDPGRTYRADIDQVGETEIAIDRDQYELTREDLSNPRQRVPDRLMEMVATFEKQEIQYFATVPLGETGRALRIGTGGQARVFTGYRSLGYRLWWWVNQNFRS